MKTKKRTILRLLIALAVVIVVVYASLPYYARQALIHWMPVIDDLETFHRHTVHHNPDDVWHWPLKLSRRMERHADLEHLFCHENYRRTTGRHCT